MAEAANLDPPLPQEKSKACSKCGKYCFRIKWSGKKGFCDKCMKLEHDERMRDSRYKHELQMAKQQHEHNKSRRSHESEEAKLKREESKLQRQHEAEESKRKVEIETSKKEQEDLKLKQSQEQTKREQIALCRDLMVMNISEEDKVSLVKEILQRNDEADKAEIKPPTNQVRTRSARGEEVIQVGSWMRAIRRSTGLRRNN